MRAGLELGMCLRFQRHQDRGEEWGGGGVGGEKVQGGGAGCRGPYMLMQ